MRAREEGSTAGGCGADPLHHGHGAWGSTEGGEERMGVRKGNGGGRKENGERKREWEKSENGGVKREWGRRENGRCEGWCSEIRWGSSVRVLSMMG